MEQRLDRRLEQAFPQPVVGARARDPSGLHDRALTDDDEQPSALGQHPLEAGIVDGQRARQRDDVVDRGIGARERIRRFHGDVQRARAQQAGACRSGEIGVDLDRVDRLGERAEARGEIPAAGADLEDSVAGLDLEGLQDPAFELRRKHVLAVPERHAHVGEGEVAIRRGRELFARHARHRFEHGEVEHVPRADLLLDHLAASGIDVDHVGLQIPVQRLRTSSSSDKLKQPGDYGESGRWRRAVPLCCVHA